MVPINRYRTLTPNTKSWRGLNSEMQREAAGSKRAGCSASTHVAFGFRGMRTIEIDAEGFGCHFYATKLDIQRKLEKIRGAKGEVGRVPRSEVAFSIAVGRKIKIKTAQTFKLMQSWRTLVDKKKSELGRKPVQKLANRSHEVDNVEETPKFSSTSPINTKEAPSRCRSEAPEIDFRRRFVTDPRLRAHADVPATCSKFGETIWIREDPKFRFWSRRHTTQQMETEPRRSKTPSEAEA